MGCKYGNRGKQAPYIINSFVPPHLVHYLIRKPLQLTLIPLDVVLMVASNIFYFVLKVLTHVNKIVDTQTLYLKHRLLT